ncbi:hypothetical protein [Runella sp.]|uniref:hypothetical protein n=1 Tax=Runella sp. TaxID=1960881 RepID=UPI003D13BA1E
MKKIVLSTMGAILLTALMISCNQPKETEVSPTTAKRGEEPLSVIDQMEKEEGVKFFKKDVTITDESGKNKVVMRFATLKEDALSAYLATHHYEIIPRFKASKAESTISQITNPLDEKKNKEFLNVERERIVTEVISKQLEKDVIGYAVKVTIGSIKNAKTLYNYAYSETHTTPDNWPEELIITVFGKVGCAESHVLYGIDYKNNWASSWYSLDGKPWDNYWVGADYGIYNWLPCEHPNHNGTRTHNVDGPYRVRFNIQHDGNYTYQWVNP